VKKDVLARLSAVLSAAFHPVLFPFVADFCDSRGRFANSSFPCSGCEWRFIKFTHQQRNTKPHTNRKKETIMKNAINKDNVGSTVLLASMFVTIAVAFGSGVAEAKAPVITKPAATSASTANAAKVETIVVTATRLK
jgi:hypothetical protein